jgi:hypothetical protein
LVKKLKLKSQERQKEGKRIITIRKSLNLMKALEKELIIQKVIQ